MKKAIMIFVSVLMISVMACSNTDEVKQNWVFTVTTVQTIVPAMPRYYPTSVTVTLDEDNLTSTQADKLLKDMSTVTTSSSGGYTLTTTITVTKAVKK